MDIVTNGYIGSEFSQQTLDLQKQICCSNNDTRKLIRWVSCSPGVYIGGQSLLFASDLSLCNWYQEVNDYKYLTVLLDPYQMDNSITLDTKFIFLKTLWPQDALNSNRILEVGINNQVGYIGSTIPYYIGPTIDPPQYNKFYIRDILNINTSQNLNNKLILNNISEHIVAISILYAK